MTTQNTPESDQWSQIQKILKGYLKGQSLVCVCLACLYSLGLFQFTPLGTVGFVIGLFTGILSFVPYLGFGLGLLSSSLAYGAMLFFESQVFSWGHVLSIFGVFLVVQLIEGLFLTPKFVGKQLGVGFLASFVALIIGGALLGPIGVILAIPAAAIFKSLVAKNKIKNGQEVPPEPIALSEKSGESKNIE